jgi:hypothetical protein
MNHHQLWLDTLNMAQQQGKPLSQALTRADEALKMADSWPFPVFPNPLDTGRSAGHKQPKFNPSNHEDALL